MSRLEDLLHTLCPDGVKYEKLGEVAVRTKGTHITAAQMKTLDKPNAPVKIFAGGKTVAYFDYTDLPEKDVNTYTSVIVKSRGVIEFEYYDKPFSHKNELWSYHSERDDVDIKFLFYFLKTQEGKLRTKATSMGAFPQIAIPDTENLTVPIPPLPVQEEIVHILDTFTALEAELENQLEAELAARTKQYDHYRNELLSFDSKSKIVDKLLVNSWDRKVEILSINEVFRTITPPKKLTRDQYMEIGTIPIIDQGQNPIVGYTEDLDASLPKNSYVLFGDHTRIIKFVDFPFAQGADGLKILLPNSDKYLPKYLYYAFINANVESRGYSRHWTYAKKIYIPVPSLEVQEKIVSILDRFDTLVNDLKTGLPAEIALRRKQYEYYRDKLLTFKSLKPTD